MPPGLIMLGILFVLVGVLVTIASQVVREDELVVIERLGVYHRVLSAGIHYIIPFQDRRVGVYSNRQTEYNIRHEFLTSDDKKVSYDVQVTYQVVDAKLRHYGSKNFEQTLSNAIQTELKSYILKYNASDLNQNQSKIETYLVDDVNEIVKTLGIITKNISLDKLV